MLIDFFEQSRSPSNPAKLPLRDQEVIPKSIDNQQIRKSNTIEIGKLHKDLSHLAVNFSQPKKDVIKIELHHGARKNVATLRTVRTLINNLIIGVTKGFKYKMRYVYAHFPINVNVEKGPEDIPVVEIRYDELRGNGSKDWSADILGTETSLARRLSVRFK